MINVPVIRGAHTVAKCKTTIMCAFTMEQQEMNNYIGIPYFIQLERTIVRALGHTAVAFMRSEFFITILHSIRTIWAKRKYKHRWICVCVDKHTHEQKGTSKHVILCGRRKPDYIYEKNYFSFNLALSILSYLPKMDMHIHSSNMHAILIFLETNKYILHDWFIRFKFKSN